MKNNKLTFEVTLTATGWELEIKDAVKDAKILEEFTEFKAHKELEKNRAEIVTTINHLLTGAVFGDLKITQVRNIKRTVKHTRKHKQPATT